MVKLRCPRTSRELRTHFELIMWFIESFIVLHFRLIEPIGNGRNNGTFEIGGFFAHPLYHGNLVLLKKNNQDDKKYFPIKVAPSVCRMRSIDKF